MGKEIILSLKDEPVELFQAEEFEKLIKYAETNQKSLNTYWRNNSREDIQLFLKYATSKLSFFENFIQSCVQQFSAFKIGKLMGAVESYGKIIYEKEQDRLVVDRLYEEGHTVKYLDDIVKLLESHGGLTHAELCEHLSLKTSTLSEAIKKVLATGIVDFRSAGKYKIYSLTEEGIRYGKYIRNQKRDIVSEEQLIMLIKSSLEASQSRQAIDAFKEQLIELLRIEDHSIKQHQKVMLHIESPKKIEIKNVEISKIENCVNEKTHVYCSWDGKKAENDKPEQVFLPIILYYENEKESNKNLIYA